MADAVAITVSAPGSLMLLGEHAVLHGNHALVCAINRRITVTLVPAEDRQVVVESALGCYESMLDRLEDHASFRFVVQAIRQHAGALPSGFRIRINSGFSADIGFGSSAAVTVALHGALMRWCDGSVPPPEQIFEESFKTVQAVQGRGSGADLAAAVFGGIVGYTTAPTFEPVPVELPLTAVYCGYKTPTPEVIRRVEDLRAMDPQKYAAIYAEMDAAAVDAIKCLRRSDWNGFGELLNRNQQLMDAMGVNTPELQEIVSTLQSCPGIFGAKISGSGMGDCAVGVGHADLKPWGYPVHHLEITPTGCFCHE